MDKINESTFIEDSEEKTHAKIGRPVDKLRDLAILKAALELVAEQGYDCVTMESIATRAHASKATLYRRWKSKPYLIADAIAYIMPCEQKVEYERCEHNLRQYLCELLSIYFGVKDAVRQKVMLSIAIAISTDELLSKALKSDCLTSHTCTFREAIKCSLDDNIDKQKLKCIENVGPALLFYQLLLTGKPIEMEYIEHIVDDVIMPLITLNKTNEGIENTNS
jgi:AcrR family transcriptional regulator